MTDAGPDILLADYSSDVIRICALDPVIELVIVELESVDDVSQSEESVDLSGVLVIEADEDPSLHHPGTRP